MSLQTAKMGKESCLDLFSSLKYTECGASSMYIIMPMSKETRAPITCLYKKPRAFVYAIIDGCRHALVPSIIGKDHGQISIECDHHSSSIMVITT